MDDSRFHGQGAPRIRVRCNSGERSSIEKKLSNQQRIDKLFTIDDFCVTRKRLNSNRDTNITHCLLRVRLCMAQLWRHHVEK